MMLVALLAWPVVAKGAGDEIKLPPNGLILFGANWCAPCLEELRDLPALARTMAPERIVLAWTDGKPVRLWREWPGNADVTSVTDAMQAIQRLGGSSAGLPYAVLLDAKGKRCADLRGKLTVARLEAMKARCRPAS
jgi:hypothetical protein